MTGPAPHPPVTVGHIRSRLDAIMGRLADIDAGHDTMAAQVADTIPQPPVPADNGHTG